MDNRIGFGKRFGAYLLDVVIVCVASFFLGSTIGGMLGLAAGGIAGSAADSSAVAGAAIGGVIGAAVGFIFALVLIGTVYMLLEGFTGFTLGKLILGIRVANEDGSPAAVPTLLGRYAIKNIGSLLRLVAAFSGLTVLGTLGGVAGLVVFIGFFLALGAKKQALHDQIMHTAVFPKALVKVA